MHVLSKLFVALVALLTAALVPMVVTYAYNEDSYKAKWQESRAEIAALQGRLDAQSGEFDAVKTGLSTRAAELEASLRAARNDAADSSARFVTSAGPLASARHIASMGLSGSLPARITTRQD